MEKAGIKGPKLGPHRIRHAFGKNYLVEGGDLLSLREILTKFISLKVIKGIDKLPILWYC